MANKLNAADVVDLAYLSRAASCNQDLAYTTDPRRALEIFAFDFIEAANVEDQNEILIQLLGRMTFGHSAEDKRGGSQVPRRNAGGPACTSEGFCQTRENQAQAGLVFFRALFLSHCGCSSFTASLNNLSMSIFGFLQKKTIRRMTVRKPFSCSHLPGF